MTCIHIEKHVGQEWWEYKSSGHTAIYLINYTRTDIHGEMAGYEGKMFKFS